MAAGASAELFKAVKERLEEQLKHAESSAKALEERRQEYEELRGLLLELPKKVQHPIMVPFGPLASFPGHLVHTNEVLTQLSSEYFALRTRDRALQLVEKRLKRIGHDEESVAREVRELTMQQQVASGEAAPGARPSPSERSTVRSVPGVPGATVRLDEEGFMDIREPAIEDTRMTSGGMDGTEETLDGWNFWQTGTPSEDGALSRRLRELEELEAEGVEGAEGAEDVDASTQRAQPVDEMLELDQLMEQYEELPPSQSQPGGTSDAPKALSPADLYKLMGDTGSPDDAVPVSDSIVANVIREHQAPLPTSSAPASSGAPKRVSKFKAERQRE